MEWQEGYPGTSVQQLFCPIPDRINVPDIDHPDHPDQESMFRRRL